MINFPFEINYIKNRFKNHFLEKDENIVLNTFKLLWIKCFNNTFKYNNWKSEEDRLNFAKESFIDWLSDEEYNDIVDFINNI